MTPLKICYSSFLLPKSDSDLVECQDALCTPLGGEPSVTNELILSDNEPLRFAVADGVTTAFYSGYWAGQLVSLFHEHEGLLGDWNQDAINWKQAADVKWQENILKRELGSISQNRLSEQDPAASTFCGIEIRASNSDSSELEWKAVAVGDSCVIHLSTRYNSENESDADFFAHPCKRSSDFSCVTAAISSYEENHLPDFQVLPAQPLQSGDVLLLATDALCEWMIKFHENGFPVWKSIVDLDSDKFQWLVKHARLELDFERCLKDDDVALIVVRIGEQLPSFPLESWVYVPGPTQEIQKLSKIDSNFSAFLSEATSVATSKEHPTLPDANNTQPEILKPEKKHGLCENLMEWGKTRIGRMRPPKQCDTPLQIETSITGVDTTSPDPDAVSPASIPSQSQFEEADVPESIIQEGRE